MREIIRFPSGFETTIRVTNCDSKGFPYRDTNEEITIVARISEASDIFLIAQGVDSLRRIGYTEISLFLPFVPNARQDRAMVNGDAFGLKVFANYINSLKFRKVTVFDPHSNVTSALLENCVVIPAYLFVVEVLKNETGAFTLIAPDEGAIKKTELSAITLSKDFVFANKKRNPKTGEILDTKIYGDVKDKVVYILDDICDGGATFISLTQKLKQEGASEVNLIVSHGIFSKGLDVLYASSINTIHTTNSVWQSSSTPKIYNLLSLVAKTDYLK